MAVSARKSATGKTAAKRGRPAKPPASTTKSKTARRFTSPTSVRDAQALAPRKRGRPPASRRATFARRKADTIPATQFEAINNEIAALRTEIQDLRASIDVLSAAVNGLLKANAGGAPAVQEKSSAEPLSSPGTIAPDTGSSLYSEVREEAIE